MSDFSDSLVLEPDGGKWVTTQPLVFEIGVVGSGLDVTVPSGFRTDLGTIPGVFRVLVKSSDPRIAASFVVHDYLCVVKGFDRWMADAVFLEAMDVTGVSWWRRMILWTGVRLFAIVTGKK